MITIEGVELLSLKEVCEILGITIQSLRRQVRMGIYHPVVVGKKRYISREQLQTYLREGRK